MTTPRALALVDGGDAPDDDRVKAHGYVRVSTARQGDSGLGLEVQVNAIRAACEQRGWRLARMFREVESSGKKRPVLAEAEAAARDAGSVLVVAKYDRIARTALETLLIHERATREGWHLFVADMPDVDTTTTNGRLFMTIMAGVAEAERDMIRQRTKAALAVAKLKGTKSGRAIGRPLATEAEARKARPEAAERMERGLARIRELRAEGLSFRKVAATLNDEDLRGANGGRWTEKSVRLALKRYGDS